MISLNFLDSFIKHLKYIDKKQLKYTFSQLSENYSILYHMTNVLQDSVIILDKDQVPAYMNQAAQDFFFLKDNHIHEPFYKFVPHKPLIDMLEYFSSSDEHFLKQETFIEGFSLRVWDVHLSKIFVGEENTLYYVISIRDITNDKKIISQKQRKKNILSMEHLAAALAHEIKNPLAAIHLHLNLVFHELNNLDKYFQLKEIKDYLKVLEEEINRINTITTEFLNTIRPLSLKLQKLNLNDVIKDSVEILYESMRQENIHFQIREQDNLAPVLGDSHYLKMVFLNLIKNAIESFNTVDRNSESFITIQLQENHPFIEVTIRDNGVGIATDDLEKIFEPYFTTKSYGSGVGLAIVYKIIHEHKGDIQVKSVLNKGTEIIILLPSYNNTIRKFLENS